MGGIIMKKTNVLLMAFMLFVASACATGCNSNRALGNTSTDSSKQSQISNVSSAQESKPAKPKSSTVSAKASTETKQSSNEEVLIVSSYFNRDDSQPETTTVESSVYEEQQSDNNDESSNYEEPSYYDPVVSEQIIEESPDENTNNSTIINESSEVIEISEDVPTSEPHKEESIENDESQDVSDNMPVEMPQESNQESSQEISTEAESSIAEIEQQTTTWAITRNTCTLDNGITIDRDTYLRVILNDEDSDKCAIQWYDDTAEINKSDINIFEIPHDKEEMILMRRTAGVIVAHR